MAKRIKNSIVEIGGEPHLKCDTCKGIFPAKKEYFKCCHTNSYGIRSRCKACQAEYDRKKWIRYRVELQKRDEAANKLLTASGIQPIEDIDNNENAQLKKDAVNMELMAAESNYKTLLSQVRCLMKAGYIMDARIVNIRFRCGHEAARRVVSDINRGIK